MAKIQPVWALDIGQAALKALKLMPSDSPDQVVAEAFERAKSVEDVVTMLKLREICRHLANAADRADEAANIIADIVVKIT